MPAEINMKSLRVSSEMRNRNFQVIQKREFPSQSHTIIFFRHSLRYILIITISLKINFTLINKSSEDILDLGPYILLEHIFSLNICFTRTDKHFIYLNIVINKQPYQFSKKSLYEILSIKER